MIFGGVGSGLYGIIVMAVLAVFIAGLMVGRTPEYLGKKIEAREMKLAMLYVLIFPAIILIPTAVAVSLPSGLSSISNPGPHGFSQILYAFTQAGANNGSAFAGLNANTGFYNVTIAIVMLLGSFMMAIPALAIAGSVAAKKTTAASAGTFPTDGVPFVFLLIGVIVIVGALTFFLRRRAGPDRRTTPDVVRETLLGPTMPDRKAPALWNREIVSRAAIDSFVKLDPRLMIKNPVMFVVEVTSVLTMFTLFRDSLAHRAALAAFEFQIALWLWFTVLFANFAEAMAEGRGKAQAENLRKTRTETLAKLITNGETKLVPATQLRRGDVVMVAAGDVIPGDGEVIEGVAAVNEAAITGESAPVIRESGGDRSAVTGGTTVISDWIKVRITANPGETFLDRMIALVEGAAAPENSQRNRAEHSAFGSNHRFPARHRHALPVRPVRRNAPRAAGARGAAGLSDSDHDRRIALRDRNRRNGSSGSAQRARDVRPRG